MKSEITLCLRRIVGFNDARDTELRMRGQKLDDELLEAQWRFKVMVREVRLAARREEWARKGAA